MATMGKKRPRRRRSLTPEFKAEIIDACRRGDRSIVARDFDLTETAVRACTSSDPRLTWRGARSLGLGLDDRPARRGRRRPQGI